MLDLDFFKKVNDEHGHVVGDKVLAILGHYLLEHIRSFDKVFRYGGEEFLLCLNQVNLDEAFKIVDHIRAEIAMLPFNVNLAVPLHITVSCGVAALDPNITVEESIDRSDKALYAAKTSGRNQTQIWHIEDKK